MKTILIIGGVIIVVLSVLLFTLEPAAAPAPAAVTGEKSYALTPTMETTDTLDAERRTNPDPTTPTPTEGKLKVSNFSGKLEAVNTGCFADGECYLVVDGKHITTTMGWSQETVGSIIGAPSIGDLEGKIGSSVEVYARDNGDGTYSLYGSAGFYVKIIE